jgi:hypothetical protein
MSRMTDQAVQQAPAQAIQEPKAAKKPYITPVLEDLGTVADFSLGGSGLVSENAQMTAPRKKP